MSELEVSGNRIPVVFKNITSTTALSWEVRPFYFSYLFDPGDFTLDDKTIEYSGIIPDASLEVRKEYFDKEDEAYEYKLSVQVGAGRDDGNTDLFNELSIHYRITLSTGEAITGEYIPNENGYVDLYYDDMLKHHGYGRYPCIVTLRYHGQSYGAVEKTLVWEEIKEEEIIIGPEKRIEIIDFELLYLDKDKDTAQLYLEYERMNLEGATTYSVQVLSRETGDVTTGGEYPLMPVPVNGFIIINNIPVPEGDSIITCTLKAEEDELLRSREIRIVNSYAAPEVVLTNQVSSYIPFNNVMFTWTGSHEGTFKEDIAYTYNVDGHGWSAPDPGFRKCELFSLAEGWHSFKVKAVYMNTESCEETAAFFVDITKPVFDPDKINVEKQVDEYGFLTHVTITGEKGAVTDASFTGLLIDDQPLQTGEGGVFIIKNLPITLDGENQFVITACDAVGNATDYTVNVQNHLTDLIFPETGHVRYAPMTIVGTLAETIHAPVNIYIKDPLCKEGGEEGYKEWLHGKVNEDRIYFVEDVYIHPGSFSREAYTPLIQVLETPSGRIYTKEIHVWAKELLRPIDMDLTTHSAPGENAEAEITISCKARIDTISSWSIDFNGDGIYDNVHVVSNPDLEKQKEWTHVYSTLGLVKPRVRIITLDGNYFSVCDEIIIHEEIKEASHKMISNPIAMTSVKMPDKSERIFVLRGGYGSYGIKVYEVRGTEHFITDKDINITLDGYGIDNPVRITAPDESHVYIGANRNGTGYVHVFAENEFGNYLPLPDRGFTLTDTIRSLTVTGKMLYVTMENTEYIACIPVENSLPVPDRMELFSPEVPYSGPPGPYCHIEDDGYGILISDYYHQRILRCTDSLNVIEHNGTFGSGEGQFLKPSWIASYENRTFIYDEGRYDIQVFGPDFQPVTLLAYDPEAGENNYFEQEFLSDIAGISVIAREENYRLYYYALLLSRSREKLALLKMPQWEELRARMRNNTIVFLDDQEVYRAKPTGSDLAKLVSSDSIPRIEGTIDYPALSPDGHTLVFTSRTDLYVGSEPPAEEENIYTYDNLYVMEVSGENLRRIPLNEYEQYEIERPVFNSNGTNLIFSAREQGGIWQIYIYDFKTGSIKKLIDTDENLRFPYYSPDDRFVVFTTDYDGDEDIEIVKLYNTNERITLTSNNARDSYPVWSPVYAFEIDDRDTEIESKISFVSERNYHKGIYYTYILHNTETDIHVVTQQGQEIGDDPDSAAIEITDPDNEGDYPCFTGDGRSMVMEYFDGSTYNLKRYDFDKQSFTVINTPEGARKPAGMKNTISNFEVQPVNGDQLKLTWTPYLEEPVFYTIRYKPRNENKEYAVKRIRTLGSALIEGLEMGMEYLVHVSISENDEDVAKSHELTIQIPEVAARPTIVVDTENPYRVHLYAWKPDEETEWSFSWIVDNQEITTAHKSTYYSYEFATSGTKEIMLKAENKTKSESSISDPIPVDIISDITPVIEYTIIYGDTNYINLSAEKSSGNKIKLSSATWTLSGPGREPLGPVHGDRIILPLTGFRHNLLITLHLTREPVTGQASSDIISKSIRVDLDYDGVKPVITYTADDRNQRLLTFSGENSLGNINWREARWFVYTDGVVIHQETGVSSFGYEFPATARDTNYSVTLTVPDINDQTTETASAIISIGAQPIEPVIDYEVVTLRTGGVTEGAKLLLFCSGSKGSSIDFARARWSIPIAATYGESPDQTGPTAIYNLMNIGKSTYIDITLSLCKQGGTEWVTVTERKLINTEYIEPVFLNVQITEDESYRGKTLAFDVLSSTGPNINWTNTKWEITGPGGEQFSQGPVTAYEVPASGEESIITYVCTLERHGDEPVIKRGSHTIGSSIIKPAITYDRFDNNNPNAYWLDVSNTAGANIEWARTTWYIYDGSETVTQKYGARIMHAFTPTSEAHGYPVMVEMFFKDNTKSFVGYTSIDVEGDELIPDIDWDTDGEREDPNVIHFSALRSTGSNIDWAQTRWTFGDSSEAQYDPVTVHKYPPGSEGKSYKVSLTITRRNRNQTTEVKTTYKTITIGADKIEPRIYAKLYDNGYLVLSAAESGGRGLQLDRSVWLFEGEGDNESAQVSEQTGSVENSSHQVSGNINCSFTTGVGTEVKNPTGVVTGYLSEISVGVSTGYGYTTGTTTYDDYKNNTESFSSSNIHTGVLCRKYVREFDTSSGEFDVTSTIRVTLAVYRVESDGSIVGRYITRNINLTEARGGKLYE